MDLEQKQRTILRQYVFQILEHGRRREPASRAIDWILVLLVVANVASTVAQTVPDIAARHGITLQIFDRVCVLVFALEYAARIWAAPEHPLLRQHSALGARLRFASTPLMIIDALALVPLLLELLFPQHGLLLLTRLVRFLKLARYSPALATIGRVIAGERRALLACVIIFLGVLLGAAAAMYAVEGAVQPDRLGDMPKAMWWAATMLAKNRNYTSDHARQHHRSHHGHARNWLLCLACSYHRAWLLRADPSPRLRCNVRHGRPSSAFLTPGCQLDRRTRGNSQSTHCPGWRHDRSQR